MNTYKSHTIRKMVSLRQYFLLCWKNKINILGWVIIFGLIGCLMSQTIFKPQYKAETQIMVQPKATSNSQAQTNNDPIITCKDLITSTRVMNAVSAKLDYKVSASKLTHSISVENTQNSQLITINVKLDSPQSSYIAANALTSYLNKHSKRLMDGTNIKVLSYSEMPTHSTIYSPVFQSIVGGVVGLIISLVIILMSAYLSPTIYDPAFIENELGERNLGTISFNKNLGDN